MSATADTRIPASEAAAACRRFLKLIDDVCERIVVAGSLRRRATMVKDVEIVCVPRVETVQTVEPGLFEDVVTERRVDRLHERMENLEAGGLVRKRLSDKSGSPHWGPLTKYLLFEGVPFDLFSTEADRFGWTLAIRTGPQQFSRQLVVERGHKTEDRRPGLLPTSLFVKQGINDRKSGRFIPTPEERDVFALFNQPYREPEHRR